MAQNIWDAVPVLGSVPVRVLNGHTDQDTAYLVEDYPYGSLRCKIRYWVETATSGAKKGQQRFVAQTTNPKRPGQPWNKPHASTYAPIVVMYLDGKDHVQWWAVSDYSHPAAHVRLRLTGIYDQLPEAERVRYDGHLRNSLRHNSGSWGEWEEKIDAIADHIRVTGEDPVLRNGVWVQAPGQLRHIGEEDLPVYLAVARERLEVQR